MAVSNVEGSGLTGRVGSWPQPLNKIDSRTRWASLVEGAVLLVSTCKVAVSNVEGSGLTGRVGSCPQPLNKIESRTRWASLVEGAVLLVSTYKVVVPNVEESGLTERVGFSGGTVGNAINDPRRKDTSGHYLDFIEQNDKVLHRNCTTHRYSR